MRNGLVEGVSLRALLQQSGAMAPEAAASVLAGTLLTLAGVHGDVRPEHIMVDASGGLTVTGFDSPGPEFDPDEPTYIAPERIDGDPATPAADVFSATAVFFECLTAEAPFRAANPEDLHALHEYTQIIAEFAPEELRPLIQRGLSADPADRPATPHEFLAEVEAVASAAYGDDWQSQGHALLATWATATASSDGAELAGPDAMPEPPPVGEPIDERLLGLGAEEDAAEAAEDAEVPEAEADDLLSAFDDFEAGESKAAEEAADDGGFSFFGAKESSGTGSGAVEAEPSTGAEVLASGEQDDAEPLGGSDAAEALAADGDLRTETDVLASGEPEEVVAVEDLLSAFDELAPHSDPVEEPAEPEDAEPEDAEPEDQELAEPEAAAETGSDSEPDAEPEAEPDSEPDAGPEAEPDVEPDAEPETEPDPEPEPEPAPTAVLESVTEATTNLLIEPRVSPSVQADIDHDWVIPAKPSPQAPRSLSAYANSLPSLPRPAAEPEPAEPVATSAPDDWFRPGMVGPADRGPRPARQTAFLEPDKERTIAVGFDRPQPEPEDDDEPLGDPGGPRRKTLVGAVTAAALLVAGAAAVVLGGAGNSGPSPTAQSSTGSGTPTPSASDPTPGVPTGTDSPTNQQSSAGGATTSRHTTARTSSKSKPPSSSSTPSTHASSSDTPTRSSSSSSASASDTSSSSSPSSTPPTSTTPSTHSSPSTPGGPHTSSSSSAGTN